MTTTQGLLSAAILVALAGCQNTLPFGDGAGSFERAKREGSAPPALVARFHQIDKNGDGVIDPTEARSDADLMGAFGTADRDGDRQLSLEEFLDSQATEAP
ncbi:hypothetical protein EVC62_10045 [Salinicola endophyticus]|uniref:EF-hand domain-containing protein n=1 Tax=Salinicola endophyticus TaxID=1949083 RepID=A0ABY8FJM2_9GAMM|nr:hypothetical protein [Salinicola endophyticus]WFF41813.1 hypothetical protein EVC62_10045 [Salinicola endophyticus]